MAFSANGGYYGYWKPLTLFDITLIKIGPLINVATGERVEYEYHSDFSDSDRSRTTLDHAMSPDWSLGTVHVMGVILLVITGEGSHVWGMINT